MANGILIGQAIEEEPVKVLHSSNGDRFSFVRVTNMGRADSRMTGTAPASAHAKILETYRLGLPTARVDRIPRLKNAY